MERNYLIIVTMKIAPEAPCDSISSPDPVTSLLHHPFLSRYDAEMMTSQLLDRNYLIIVMTLVLLLLHTELFHTQ